MSGIGLSVGNLGFSDRVKNSLVLSASASNVDIPLLFLLDSGLDGFGCRVASIDSLPVLTDLVA